MNLKQRIEQDLKAALLGGDKVLVMTLRGLKSAILYAEVAAGKRDEGLSDEEGILVLRKELKKRHESADLYEQGGNKDRQQAEITEAKVIEKYLPAQLDDSKLSEAIDQAIEEIGVVDPQSMGKIIGKVKELTQGAVDGARIATSVKARMESK